MGKVSRYDPTVHILKLHNHVQKKTYLMIDGATEGLLGGDLEE